MKKITFYTFLFAIAILLFMNVDTITNKIADLLKKEPIVIISDPNNYYKNIDYLYVQNNESFIPYSMQDIKNIFYSVLNRGYSSFTFYCPDVYTECINDVKSLSNNKDILTHINNLISPFNSFSTINIVSNTSGEVNIIVNKLYSQDDVIAINNKMDEILNTITNIEMSTEDKILVIHDYIINNTKYDTSRVDGQSTYKSATAYGTLLEGYAVCGGYADAMALFLNRVGVSNYKVASETHVWNAVNLNNTWLNLDLTWDDPVTENSDINTLIHKFYLITTEKLEGYDITDHDFDKTIYQELNF